MNILDRKQKDELALDEAQEAGVRFMTIHKAKGLEFSVVILADAVLSPGRSSRTGLIERPPDSPDTPSRLELQLGPRALAWSTQGWQNACGREQEREMSEERRLWYVAATRVRNHLIVPFLPTSTLAGQRNESVWTAWQTGEIAFPEHPETLDSWPHYQTQQQTQQDVPASNGRPIETHAGTYAGREKHLTLPHQFPTDDTALRRYRSWEAERQSLSNRGRHHRAVFSIADFAAKFANQTPYLGPNLRLGRAVAFALHLDKQAESQTIETIETIDDQQPTSQESQETQRLVQNILSSPIIHRAKVAQRYFAEYAFSLHYQSNPSHDENCDKIHDKNQKHNETRDCLLNGVIEFAFLEHRREKNAGQTNADKTTEQLIWTLVDFRTDPISFPLARERASVYRPSLLLQALALEKLTPYSVKDCIVLFAHLPYEVSFSWNDTSRADAQALLANYIERKR